MRSYSPVDSLRMVLSGNDYFDSLERLIDTAIDRIHLQTYIFDADHTGSKMIQALERAAARGVSVWVMADAYGSNHLTEQQVQDLVDAGVEFRFYSPFLSSESIFAGRRMHHKILVVDKRSAIIGGINIADKYNALDMSAHAWLDYALEIQGEVCQYLDGLCEQFYTQQPSKLLAAWERVRPVQENQSRHIRFRRNDWITGKNEIHHTYMEAIRGARTSITIAASYFLPGTHVRRLLREATQRGVTVKVIMTGLSDVATVRLAESYMYDYYLRNDIQLFEWTNSMMHGKVMIVDNNFMTVGSYNMNFLSHYVSIELNADVIEHEVIHEFNNHFEQIMSTSCVWVNKEVVRKRRNPIIQFFRFLSYNFFRFLMFTTVFSIRYRLKRHRQANPKRK